MKVTLAGKVDRKGPGIRVGAGGRLSVEFESKFETSNMKAKVACMLNTKVEGSKKQNEEFKKSVQEWRDDWREKINDAIDAIKKLDEYKEMADKAKEWREKIDKDMEKEKPWEN